MSSINTNINRKARAQLRKLYVSNFLANISIAGAAWVALLASRGFSMQEIMFAETVFHIVSLVNEVPSGLIADIFGRKKSLILSCLLSITSALVMILINSYGGVLLSIGLNALSYNYGSGTDSALAFDTLKESEDTSYYDRFSSLQSVIYRVATGLASLSAGLALWMGYINAEFITVGLCLIQLALLITLKENRVIEAKQNLSLSQRFHDCYTESLGFLRHNREATRLIFRNALVGAIDILLLFALQDKLQRAGAGQMIFGPMLFIMYLGGVLGSIAAEKAGNIKLTKLFLIAFGIVLAGGALAFTGNPWLMTLGGFIAAFSDDLIQIRSDIALNNMIPAGSRATLISVNSFCFSVVMIVLSPLAGVIFS